MVEQRIRNAWVGGSSPSCGTIDFKNLLEFPNTPGSGRAFSGHAGGTTYPHSAAARHARQPTLGAPLMADRANQNTTARKCVPPRARGSKETRGRSPSIPHPRHRHLYLSALCQNCQNAKCPQRPITDPCLLTACQICQIAKTHRARSCRHPVGNHPNSKETYRFRHFQPVCESPNAKSAFLESRYFRYFPTLHDSVPIDVQASLWPDPNPGFGGAVRLVEDPLSELIETDAEP